MDYRVSFKHLSFFAGILFLIGCSEINIKISPLSPPEQNQEKVESVNIPTDGLSLLSLTDLGKIPEDKYFLITYGPMEINIDSDEAKRCESVWASSFWRLDYDYDWTYPVPEGCKAFRFPVVIKLLEPWEINDIPCDSGLVGFYSTENLAFCILNHSLRVGNNVLSAGSYIGLDIYGLYNFPSETRRISISIDSVPSKCTDIKLITPGDQQRNSFGLRGDSFGRAPTNINNVEDRTYILECDCNGKKIAKRYACGGGNCTYNFTCN